MGLANWQIEIENLLLSPPPPLYPLEMFYSDSQDSEKAANISMSQFLKLTSYIFRHEWLFHRIVITCLGPPSLPSQNTSLIAPELGSTVLEPNLKIIFHYISLSRHVIVQIVALVQG